MTKLRGCCRILIVTMVKLYQAALRWFLDLMEEIEGEWDKFTSPFILIQSGMDKSVDPFLGIDFEKACKSKDKTVIYFKDMWHTVFAED
jgi:esterase/lipase